MNYSNIDIECLKMCFGNISSANYSWDIMTVMDKCKMYPEWFSASLTLIIFSVFGVISLVSLCMVFAVYWVLPELNNLHGKIVLSNAVSIAFLTSFLLTVFNGDLDDHLCKTVGFFGYFASISMFSWMSIMCFDLCHTFLRENITSPSTQHLTFLFYSMIGWGSGIILTILLWVLEQILPLESDFHPGIGIQSCFISEMSNKILYLFHFPILILMVINISFFVIIISFLIKAHLITKQARNSRR
jgi:hypothetical protein